MTNPAMHRVSGIGWTLFVSLLFVGCEAKPRAPALTDDPVYQSDQIGLRFLAPEGWKQVASAMIPPGPQDEPRQLVGYRSPRFDAVFEVLVIDLPDGADPLAVAKQPSHGVVDWKPTGTPEPLTVGEAPAQRFRMTGVQNSTAHTKEVVAVRRGGRVMLFVLIAPASDKQSGEVVRRAIASATWRD